MNPGILFTAATHHSVENAVRMAASIEWIPGLNGIVFAGVERAELVEIKRAVPAASCLLSTVDNLYFCRALGFLWALMVGIPYDYICSCDDDLEFVPESSALPQRLRAAEQSADFSLLTFNNHSHHYDEFSERSLDGFRLEPLWVNGDSMFVRWHDVLSFGLPDSLPDEPVTYFSEIEYQHRLRLLTGRPLVVDCGLPRYYIHHFREPGPITQERAGRAGQGIAAGQRFWREKYAVEGIDVADAHSFPELLERMTGKAGFRMLLFDGLPTWGEILIRYADYFEVVP